VPGAEAPLVLASDCGRGTSLCDKLPAAALDPPCPCPLLWRVSCPQANFCMQLHVSKCNWALRVLDCVHLLDCLAEVRIVYTSNPATVSLT
jgi:hypothetical protein